MSFSHESANECQTRGPLAKIGIKFIWSVGFTTYFLIMASYFAALWVGMKLNLRPAFAIIEEPGLFLRRFVDFWNWLPAPLKIWLSHQNKFMYELPITKHYIKPYQYWNYKNVDEYMANFKPYFGGEEYSCFQDFFAREWVKQPEVKTPYIIPCEGLLCDVGNFEKERVSNVKGDRIALREIFGRSKNDIPSHYQFLNVFLSNRDYHHIHSPVTGTIRKVERIAGELIVLRPWFYKQNPSLPALINERVNIDIEDEQGRIWFLSVVGGAVVNSILVSPETRLGSKISVGQKITGFELGSTCCMAFPEESNLAVNTHVKVFEEL